MNNKTNSRRVWVNRPKGTRMSTLLTPKSTVILCTREDQYRCSKMFHLGRSKWQHVYIHGAASLLLANWRWTDPSTMTRVWWSNGRSLSTCWSASIICTVIGHAQRRRVVGSDRWHSDYRYVCSRAVWVPKRSSQATLGLSNWAEIRMISSGMDAFRTVCTFQVAGKNSG